MGFHEVQLPPEISHGSRGGAGFNTNVIRSADSGIEQAVTRNSIAQHHYDFAEAVKTDAQLAALKAFFLARGGSANGFRLKDWLDFTSNPTDPSYTSTVGTMDQLIGTGDGTTTTFQLIKTYTSGPTNYVRKITKPVTGSPKIFVNSVQKSEGTDYTIDYTTGIVTFMSAPGNGLPVHASFVFDVPVRFDQEIDKAFLAQIDEYNTGSILSLTATEIKDPAAGSVSEYFYGGAYEVATGANLTLSTGLGRVWVINSTASSLSHSLPDPTSIPTGGPIFYVINQGANSFNLKNNAGTTLLSLASNQACEVVLSIDGGGAKVWYAL